MVFSERVAAFLPKICTNYTIIDTKDYPMEGISGKYRSSLSHLIMHAINQRMDDYGSLMMQASPERAWMSLI